MFRRLALVTLFAVSLAVSASGCCVDACGTRRGMLGRPLRQQFDGECPDGMCGRRVFHPLQAARNRLTCGAGCGEFYLDEWMSDPPDCCDPCDGCGNYTGRGGCGGCWGGGCGGCRPGLFGGGFWNLWGHRYSQYDSYGGFGYDDMGDGEVIYEGEMTEGTVVPGKPSGQSPTPAARNTESALKKTGTGRPYYEQDRPTSSRRMPASRSAAKPQFAGPAARYMR